MRLLKSIIVALVLTVLATPAASAARVFKDYSDNGEITSVYISAAAMRLGMKSMFDDADMKQTLSNISNPGGMEVITASSPASVETLRGDCRSIIADLGMEILIETREKDEYVNIFTGSLIDDNTARDILIETSSPSEYTVVFIKGDININGFINDDK